MALHPPVRTNVEAFIGAHPLLLSLLALTSSASIELFQAWPEIVPLGQEVGEVIRNLGYGIAAAFAFNWIMVDIPRKQEERRILDSYWWHLNRMAHSSGMLLASYRELAPDGEYDTTTEHGMKALLSEIDLIEAYTVPAPNVSITTNGIKNIWSDPFADTTEIKEIEGFGLAVLPFIHRLHPAVADAVTELVHFRQNMNGLEPISRSEERRVGKECPV